MDVATQTGMKRVIAWFIVIISTLFWFFALNAHAQTSQEYIASGEQSLYSENIGSILAAHSTFEEAAALYPDDPVINLYLAFTRLLYLGFTYDSVGATPLINQYGITRSGIDIDSLEYDLPLDEDDKYDVPQGAPTTETVRAYLQNEFLNAVESSIANLDITISNWNSDSKHIAVIANTGRDQDIELDWGDAWLFRSFLKALKSVILVVTAYDLDVDLREVAALENLEAFEFPELLERYQSFLKLLPQASNPSVEGSALLDHARLRLIEAIDDYMVASDAIRNDFDLAPGAEELVEIDECDQRVEEWMRGILTDIRNSLQEPPNPDDPPNPDVLIIKKEEQWTLTDTEDTSKFQIFIPDLESDSSYADYRTNYGDNFVGLEGEIVCITIEENADENNVYLKLESDEWPYTEIEFSGTLNPGGDQIINGTYVGWNWDGPISGDFTAVRTNLNEETEWINPNPAFGKGRDPYDPNDPNDPYHLRNFLPAFNECDDPIYGTVGYGLDPSPDSTLGGILLDFNQADWGIDQDPCIPGDGTISGILSVPNYSGSGTIFIQAFRYDGWYNLDPGNRVGMTTIYADEFWEGMTYSLDYVPTGYPLLVSAWWDINSNGIFNYEDVEMIPPDLTPEPEPDDNPLDLQIGVDISGIVFESDGVTPVSAAGITVYAVQGNPCGYHWEFGRADVNSLDGTYVIAGVSTGSYYFKTSSNAMPGLTGEWWTSTGSTLDCTLAEPAYVDSLGRADIDFQLDSAAGLSGSVTDDTGKPVAGLRVLAYQNQCDGKPLPASAETDAAGSYTIYGLTAGELYVRACSSCSGLAYGEEWFDGGQGSGDCQDALPVLVELSKTTGGINFQLTGSYRIVPSIMNVHQPDGSFDTYLEVEISDFPGILPDDIDSITVTGPDGFDELNQNDLSFSPQWNSWFVAIDGSPPAGIYTITVESWAGQLTATEYQYNLRTLPIVDQSLSTPADGSTVSAATPIFTWQPVDYPADIAIFYRMEIYDELSGNRVFASQRLPNFQYITLPSGILTTGQTYRWRVRVIDNNDWVKIQNRSNSAWSYFTVADILDLPDAEPAIDLDGFGVSTWSTQRGSDLENWIIIIDKDGIAYDGSSHTAAVEFPDQSSYPMQFVKSVSPTAAAYEYYHDRHGTTYHVYAGDTYAGFENGYHPEDFGYAFLGSANDTGSFNAGQNYSYYVIVTYPQNIAYMDTVESSGSYYSSIANGNINDWQNVGGPPDQLVAEVGGIHDGYGGGFMLIQPPAPVSTITVHIDTPDTYQPLQSGPYEFTVTDLLGGGSGRVTEELVLNVLEPPQEESFEPSLINPTNEYISATFDNVYVNGELYEDFESYGSIDELDPTKWRNNYNVGIGDGNAVSRLKDSVGRPTGGFGFANSNAINSISADITIGDVSSNSRPRARIAGTWCHNGNADVWVSVNVKGDKVDWSVSEQWINKDLTWTWRSLANGVLLTGLSPDQTITVGVSMTGNILTFTADDGSGPVTEPYTVEGTINPPIDADKNLQARINLITDTTPTFSWDAITGANRYRIKVNNADNSKTIWNGYTEGSVTSYRVPPGVLKPDVYYRFRTEAWDAVYPTNTDNVSKTPPSDGENYIFYTDSLQTEAPYIELDHHGVHTWNDDQGGEKLSFWIKVHDAQGVPEDIQFVKVKHPGGTEELLNLYESNPYSPISSTSGIYILDSTLPPAVGTYEFTVEDKAGNPHTVSEELFADDIAPIAPPQSLQITGMDGTAVTFDWSTVTGAALYTIHIFDYDFNLLYSFHTTESTYQLAAGFLEIDRTYRWRIHARRELFGNNVDNMSGSPASVWDSMLFSVGSPADNDDGVGDGIPDYWEELHGLNPDINDANEDPDNDDLTNIQEFQNATDPNNPDTDGDWAKDGDEVNNGTDPNEPAEFTPAGTGAIRGTVRDTDGTPITGTALNVNIYSNAKCGANWLTNVAVDESNGRYIFIGLAPGQFYTNTYHLNLSNYVNEWWASFGSQIDCRDAQAITVAAAGLVDNADFQLDLGGEISGSLADSATGLIKIENVWVNAHNDLKESGVGASTDANGNYTIRGIPAGCIDVRAYPPSASDYIISAEQFIALDEDEFKTGVDFALDSGALTISGTVTDGVNPLGGVDVRYENEALDIHQHTNTDSFGDYQLTNLPQGEAIISVQAWGTDLAFSAKVIENLTGDLTNFDFNLVVGACASGRVVDENGSGLPDIRVDVEVEPYGFDLDNDTDANGYFTVCNLPEGIGFIFVNPDIGTGYCSSDDRFIYVNGEVNNQIGTIPLQPCTLVQGSFNYAGLSQQCFDLGDVEIWSEGIDFESEAEIEADGSYRILLPDGTHTLYFEMDDDDESCKFVSYPAQVTIQNGTIESGPEVMEIIYDGHPDAGTITGTVDKANGTDPAPSGEMFVAIFQAR